MVQLNQRISDLSQVSHFGSDCFRRVCAYNRSSCSLSLLTGKWAAAGVSAASPDKHRRPSLRAGQAEEHVCRPESSTPKVRHHLSLSGSCPLIQNMMRHPAQRVLYFFTEKPTSWGGWLWSTSHMPVRFRFSSKFYDICHFYQVHSKSMKLYSSVFLKLCWDLFVLLCIVQSGKLDKIKTSPSIVNTTCLPHLSCISLNALGKRTKGCMTVMMGCVLH